MLKLSLHFFLVFFVREKLFYISIRGWWLTKLSIWNFREPMWISLRLSVLMNELFGVMTMTDMYVKLVSMMNGCNDEREQATQHLRRQNVHWITPNQRTTFETGKYSFSSFSQLLLHRRQRSTEFVVVWVLVLAMSILPLFGSPRMHSLLPWKLSYKSHAHRTSKHMYSWDPSNESVGRCLCVCMWVSRSVPWSLFNWIYIKSLCFETDCILHRMLDDAFALEIMNFPFNWCECVACLSVCVSWSVGRIAEVVLQFDMVTNDGLCLSWVAKYTQSAGVQFQKMWKMWIARASKTSCQR